MRQLLLATSNAHKTQEIAAILGSGWKVEDLRSHPGLTLPEETGTTFEENAIIKAQGASAALPDMLVLADDSGLEVDVLQRQPGVLSARYAGENATDADNRRLLKDRLRRVSTNPGQVFPARFRCSLALVLDGEVLHVATGSVEGHVGMIEHGRGGFGYDSMFTPKEHRLTFAELPPETKNQFSHRARALEALQNWLQKNPEALMAKA
ncbi:RdgB/HAM1 family non-canonical purine NTP pyrophosphatase [Prosthecobacter sp. SYSU 5D2]|uniref:RdgB/HAM1 family non-canonical purine NTP pyrophosphatase n=1 Tax=Prosthecobacter sp. SYSU 5D2 TaxID=3134134 RepID=UPI0031FEDAE9